MKWEQVWEAAFPFVKMALILLIGRFLVVHIVQLVQRGMERAGTDPSLIRFLGKALRITGYLLVALSALAAIGVSTTGLVGVLSAAAVAVAVALRDSLSNVAGGILLLISPRFATGDYIKAGEDEGTVLGVDLLHTTLRTLDRRQVSIPNGALVASHITDYSKEPFRRVEISLPIPYEADVELAKAKALGCAAAHSKVLQEPEEPFCRVSAYGDSAVQLLVRVWCATPDYWEVFFDLTEGLRQALGEAGIGIPYNQLDVHIKDAGNVKEG